MVKSVLSKLECTNLFHCVVDYSVLGRHLIFVEVELFHALLYL